MVDNLVSVRRYIRAMISATARSECLGLVLLAGRPDDLDGDGPARSEARALSAVLGPYLGLARPVRPGEQGAGVVLPDGTRVLADGLDAACWPGSEAAFREELASPSPDGWRRTPRARHRSGSEDLAARAATEIAWYVGVESRALPAVAVLDPTIRRACVVSLTRHASAGSFAQRLVKELDDWPHRRLTVVEELVASRLERADLAGGRAPEIDRARAWFDEARAADDDHERAVWFARCSDALRSVESLRGVESLRSAGEPPDRRSTHLDATITRLRGELDEGDRARSTAEAAARAARAELGELRSTTILPPEELAGWRLEHLRAAGAVRRMIRSRP